MATYVSYRAKLSLGLASLVFSAVTFSFVGKLVARAGPGFVETYGTDYGSFVLLGVASHSAAAAGLGCFRAAIRREQLQGTLEVLLTSELPESLIVLLSGLGELAAVGVGAAALLALAGGLFGLSLDVAPAAFPALILYGLFMIGLGLASAGTILVTKEGEPISWAFGALSGLLGGVYFPVDVLPRWLSTVSKALPTTHALALVRPATAVGVTAPPGQALALLSASAAVSVALGLAVLRFCFRKARANGTLRQY